MRSWADFELPDPDRLASIREEIVRLARLI